MDSGHLKREDASRLFRRIGWGLVFQFIDFRIIYFDLLPDFIGYILIATALQGLGKVHIVFVRAKWAAVLMILASLMSEFMPVNININDLNIQPLWIHIYSQALTGLHILLAYWLFNGMEHTVKRNQLQNMELLEDIRFRRVIYLAFFGIQLFLYPFHFNQGEDWSDWIIIFSFIALIPEFLLLRLPFRLSNGFKPSLRAPIDRMQ